MGVEDFCPYCGQPIPKGQFNEFWRRIHQHEHEITKEQEQKLESELSIAYEKKLKNTESDLRRELERNYLERVKQFKTDQKSQFEKLKEEYTEKAIRLRSEYKDLINTLKEEKERAELDARRQYNKGRKESQTELLSFKLRAQRENLSLQKQIGELDRKLEQRTSEELGSTSEEEIAVLLKNEFPNDVIERVKKGREGADILQHVILNGKEISRIVYEVKNVKNWSNDFLKRALNYRELYDTKHVMIVTAAFPRGKKHFLIQKNVSIVSPISFVYVAQLLRNGIIDIERQKLSEGTKEFKMQLLYEYLNSDEFRSRITGIGEYTSQLEEILSKEEEDHQRKWERQRELHKRIRENTNRVSGKIDQLMLETPATRLSRVATQER